MDTKGTDDTQTQAPPRRWRFRPAQTLALALVVTLAGAAVGWLVSGGTASGESATPWHGAGASRKPSMAVIAGCVEKAGITSLKSLEQLTPAQRDALESCLESDGYAKAAITAAKACANEQGIGTSPDELAKLSTTQIERLKQCVVDRLQLGSV